MKSMFNLFTHKKPNVSKYAIVDTEVGLKDHKIHDIGALRFDGATYHGNSRHDLEQFLEERNIDFICGHNIVHHDAKYLFGEQNQKLLVDTLYISPILFSERPYHKLVKDDKLVCDQLNNPVNDCEKARDLLMDEIAQWNLLPKAQQRIFSSLLSDKKEFIGFFKMVEAESTETQSKLAQLITQSKLAQLIKEEYEGRICSHAELSFLIQNNPCALAYALALVNTTDHRSITPAWVLYHFPEVEHIIETLRHHECTEGCPYCNQTFEVHHNLKRFFGYDAFRTYNGEPLQENAAKAAVEGKSLLAIFPTGGGKSLTFQLPALMDGQSVHGLTVVISPLQSLMKDQVDNLVERGIADAVTINGLLDPITRSLAIERVINGDATILYIAPELLRSKTIERILMGRHIVRFVIDEAHCFSSWGQDFRVDYLYIGKFIKKYQEQKNDKVKIPVSCFTATAKQKVVQDICDYFKKWLDIDLELFASSASRTNLRYSVIHVDSDEDKYTHLRSLVKTADCPTIIYVSRTKRTKELADKLTRDGMEALPFNGKMDSDEKVANQDSFMCGKVNIIVATSAFGMGVDKSDVGLVVHYDISDSLENYVQEAGRAGRDPHLNAKCFVLYCDSDLDKHFILLNQTKLSISEIQQVWQAIKYFTKIRQKVSCSALEIARQAGWDDSVPDIETRVRTALSALEQSGYIERGNNVPHVYATGITVKNMDEARKRITESPLFTTAETEKAIRIIKSLISKKSITRAQDSEAESRIDYLADILGLSKIEIISAVGRMREDGILADSRDISAYLQEVGETSKKPKLLLENFARLEQYIINHIPDDKLLISYKQLNDDAVREGITYSSEKHIRTLLYFLIVKGYAHQQKEKDGRNMIITRQNDIEATVRRFKRRIDICRFAIDWLYNIASQNTTDTKKNAIQFSVIELQRALKAQNQSLFSNFADIQLGEVEEALLYLSKIGSLKLEGGFLILYNAMDIHRLKDNKFRYKQEDYRMLNEFYKQKIQQIHIVGEYANLMVKDYQEALQYVHDYFQMNYQQFIAKYFKGKRCEEIERNVTPLKYKKLFGELSSCQKEIIEDKVSRCIVVAAGPGSGKTRVLVHKLASLLLLEDVKHEQLLMLTFSRAAATEFKQRLMKLIGNAAHFVEIKTFHSYCFDILGRIGNLDDAVGVVRKAAEMINAGEVEANRIRKTVLVIDEAQDMSSDDFALVTALMNTNEDMRVIAVGDDDQNIFEFRGSNSQYLQQLCQMPNSRFIEMTENYRSDVHIVNSSNQFAKRITQRLKHTPIISMSKENGIVRIVKHPVFQANDTSKLIYMYQPIVEEILSHHLANSSSCVLTQTNEEAVIVLALLHKHGINGKLLQSMEGLRFCNLAEARYFQKQIEEGCKTAKSPIITNELWNHAKEKTYNKYSHSSSLPYIKRCIETFEHTNRTKYVSDLKEFIFESSVEDFCYITNSEVLVSTIHKAKGREFDNVFMLITAPQHPTDDILRRYYVAMTRAKHHLIIHTSGNTFDGLPADEYVQDNALYNIPEEIVLQLSHKDINLGFSKLHKQTILSLNSGASLCYHDYRLAIPSTGEDVAMLSKKMQEKLEEWKAKEYRVTDVIIRFIVAWKPKDAPKEEKESAILLVDLKMNKLNNK